MIEPLNLQQKAFPNIAKVVILGAESTGKTTLCKDLAAYFDTQWVQEYMRFYAQEKWDNQQKSIDWGDLIPIAQEQINLENEKAAIANRYLFCDTSLLEIMVYSYWYYNSCPSAIEKAALQHQYDLILLTKLDVPWEADDVRDSPNDRDKIDDAFVATMNKHNIPFRRIGGSQQQRVNQIAQWLTE